MEVGPAALLLKGICACRAVALAKAGVSRMDFSYECNESTVVGSEMGDKSPKANQKHKAQQQAKNKRATQKKQQQASTPKAAPRKK